MVEASSLDEGEEGEEEGEKKEEEDKEEEGKEEGGSRRRGVMDFMVVFRSSMKN